MESVETPTLEELLEGEATAGQLLQEPRTVEGLTAPHAAGAERVDYRIVIPTRGRWRSACAISSERKFKASKDTRPFILVKTLSFLKAQGISSSLVTLWTSDAEEAEHYRSALQGSYWGEVEIRVGVPGIRAQRNHIAMAYPEKTYLVSLDDDVGDILWKQYAGNRTKLESLPRGGFEQLIFHAYSFMMKYKAYIWGGATTVAKNVMNLQIDGVSTRNGELNGFLYGFINRHDACLLPQVEDATEDAERSLRFFKKDKVVLRYRMYCCDTRCWKEQGGLQELMGSDAARKEAERRGAQELQNMFPDQTLPPKEGIEQSTLMVKFRHVGGVVLPTTSAAVLIAANKLEAEVRKAEAGTSKRKRKRTDAEAISAVPRPQSPVQLQPANESAAPSEEPKARLKKPRRSISTASSSLQTPVQFEPASEVAAASEDQEDNVSLVEDSDNDNEGDAENSQFEQAFAVSRQQVQRSSESATQPGQPQPHEEDVIRHAMESGIQDLVLRYNGDGTFGDLMERALEESRAEQERTGDVERREREEFMLAKRQSCLDLGLEESPEADPADSLTGTVDSRAAPAVSAGSSSSSTDSSGSRGTGTSSGGRPDQVLTLVAMQQLVDMGFPLSEAERHLAEANGNLEVAVERCLSGASTGASSASANVPIVIDILD